MIHVGIDLHFTNMVNVAQNDNGDIIAEQKLPTSVQSLERFFSQFEKSVQAVVECKGSRYWVADWCPIGYKLPVAGHVQYPEILKS